MTFQSLSPCITFAIQSITMANDTIRYWALYSNIHTFFLKGGTVAQAMTRWISVEQRMAASYFANLTNAPES